MIDMISEFMLLSRAIVTAFIWLAYALSSDEYILAVAVIITLITGVASEA